MADRRDRTMPEEWEDIQQKFADIPGKDGIEARRKAYAPYFLKYGKDVSIDEGCRFYHPDHIELDDDVRVNVNGLFYGSGGIRVGRHTKIGPRCFIHSANHDIASDGKAYFEAGYIYDSVFIGDNCLISANVSILPGVKMDNGCFAACGAVVVKTSYPQETRLCGVPAKSMKQDYYFASRVKESPSIAILCQSKRYVNAAKLLVTSLGLPQVRVYEEGKSIPSSVHSVVVFGSTRWIPKRKNLNLWQLENPQKIIECDVKLRQWNADGLMPKSVNFPAERLIVSVPVKVDGLSVLHNASTITLYYCLKRSRKRNWSQNTNDRLEGFFFQYLLKKFAPEKSREILAVSNFMDTGLGRSTQPDIDLMSGLINELHGAKYKLKSSKALIKDFILKISSHINKKDKLEDLSIKDYLRKPEYYFANLLNGTDLFSDFFLDQLLQYVPKLNKALDLAYAGLAFIFIDNQKGVFAVYNRLISKGFIDTEFGCVRSVRGAVSYCYSPVLTAFLLLLSWMEDSDFSPAIHHIKKQNFSWLVFDTNQDDDVWTIGNENIKGHLLSFEDKAVSASLLENWLICLSVPFLEGGQYELKNSAYEPLADYIEGYWLNFFKMLQHSTNAPLLKLTPWPFGYKSALSLRYDVDRNTNTEHIKNIVDIQCKIINGCCGSWYFIPGMKWNERLDFACSLFLQERGLHVTRFDQIEEGNGVTFHSAPNAEYWRGMNTAKKIEESLVCYGEHLAAQISRPRPVWFELAEGSRQSGFWSTPLHFPLEGSTNEIDLDYFDQLKPYFEKLRKSRGHIIIGSHPDLNQEILVQLLSRLNLSKIWPATVRDAVQRCRDIMEYGAVSVVGGGEDQNFMIVANKSISDLEVLIYHPEDESCSSECVQLVSDKPKIINWQQKRNN